MALLGVAMLVMSPALGSPIDRPSEDPIEAATANGGAAYRFVGASGAASATDSELDYSYSSAGCMSANDDLQPNGEWDADLHFLTGEVITFLRFYFFDDDPLDDVGVILWKFDGAGGFENLAQLSSTGTPGFSSEGVLLSEAHVVINSSGGLVLRFYNTSNATGTSLRACGARLVYLPS